MKFLDLFSGIGGFRTGLEAAGHKCVGFIEFDKFARKSYQAIYDTKDEFTKNDIRTTKGSELPDAGIWCFGFPCQDISIAGRKKGFKGKRSSLFFEVIRLLQERIENQQTLPKYLLIENVKNLLSIDDGWAFARVQFALDKIGYDSEWTILQSSEVVPQNRERIFIIGRLRKECTSQIFPIKRQSKGFVKSRIKQIGNYCRTNSFNGNPQVGRVYDPTGIAPTLSTMQGGNRQPKILVKACLTPFREHKRQNGRRFKANNEPAFTVTASDLNGVLIATDSVAIRKLTPLECWRLQGFTDDQFYKAKNAGLSDSQLYKQAGNAVTTKVVEEIGKQLL